MFGYWEVLFALTMFLLTMGNLQYYPVSIALECDSSDDILIALEIDSSDDILIALESDSSDDIRKLLNVRLKTCLY